MEPFQLRSLFPGAALASVLMGSTDKGCKQWMRLERL
jgi:hypothetical protein